MTKLNKSHPSLHRTRLYAKSRGVRGRDGRGQPKARLESGTRTPGLLIIHHLKRSPLKPHFLLISKMQLFCSEEENTNKGRTLTSNWPCSHMSTLGQNRDVPQEKFTVICKPWQPTETKKQKKNKKPGKAKTDHVARACSAHVSLIDRSQQGFTQGPCRTRLSPQPWARLLAAQLCCSWLHNDTCHSHSELYQYQAQTTKSSHPIPVWLIAV